MRTRRKASAWSAVVAVLAAAPVVMACYQVMVSPSYVPGPEAAPCTGLCVTYKHCPASQACDPTLFCAAATCACATGAALGLEYVNGAPNTAGCCMAGVPTGRPMGTCSITLCGTGGTCCGWIIPVWPF